MTSLDKLKAQTILRESERSASTNELEKLCLESRLASVELDVQEEAFKRSKVTVAFLDRLVSAQLVVFVILLANLAFPWLMATQLW